MRRLTTLLCLLLSPVAFAQQDALQPTPVLQGTVEYEMTVQVDIELPPEMAHMRDQFPSSHTARKQLLFSETASLMKDAPKTDEDDEFGSRRFRFGRSPDEQVFSDLDTGTVVEKSSFMGRTFLIDGEAPLLGWRLTNEQAEYLGYPCLKATAMRDTVEVEAWFTSQIPVAAGPETYGGLPGLILVLIEDGGRRTYIAQSVSMDPLPEDALVPPTDGRRVTRDEYTAIVDERLRELEAERGGRRGFTIIRGN